MAEKDDEFGEVHVEPLDDNESKAAAARRMAEHHLYAEKQVEQAIRRGEFDDLPGAGKPIEGLDAAHDPDWWVKKLVEREQIAVLPPSVQLRKDDAALDSQLDQQGSEDDARRMVEAFNERVIAARYGKPEGPPLITMPRDVDETIAAWRERRAERARSAPRPAPAEPPKRRWFRRRRAKE